MVTLGTSLYDARTELTLLLSASGVYLLVIPSLVPSFASTSSNQKAGRVRAHGVATLVLADSCC
jgi:hypothetical protein